MNPDPDPHHWFFVYCVLLTMYGDRYCTLLCSVYSVVYYVLFTIRCTVYLKFAVLCTVRI